jgi:secreted Zn-dependent insulinase-like peptidase
VRMPLNAETRAAFNELRTKQQLGYVVWGYTQLVGAVSYLFIAVQSR